MIGDARGLAGTGLKMKPRRQVKREPNLDRSKRLLLAALRLWEIKNHLQPEPWQ